MSLNEIIRENKIARDRQKSLFKFSDTDSRSLTDKVKVMDDSLQAVLRVSVPGLLQQSSADDVEDSTHKTLIPPNVFNVSTLFEPTIAFIQRAGNVIPPGFEDEVAGFGTVLEDFVVRVFLPQLDERVTASFQQAVSGYDAHQVDRKLSNTVAKPPLKSSVRVMNLIHSLCNMLLTTPFHRENYSRLIIGVIVQYYQQCSARFKGISLKEWADADLASIADQLSLPAAWSQREDVIALAKEVQAIIVSRVRVRADSAIRCTRAIPHQPKRD
jgi:exocyst complex component 4